MADRNRTPAPPAATRFAERAALAQGKVGVLLVNVGTPAGTSYWPVRRYLKEFLWDERVIDVSRPLWWCILHGIVLTTRPPRVGKLYHKIWNHELDESPLRTITRHQSQKMVAAFRDHTDIAVTWAMRYGTPSIQARLQQLHEAGCDRVLLFPLYPQYTAATTASVQDKAFDALKQMRWQPALRTVPAFYHHAGYIRTLAHSLTTHLQGLAWTPDLVLASFHGLPQRYVDLGDPYQSQCQYTTRLLRQALGWQAERLKIVFQSRFGREAWLQPYADDTVRTLARQGVRRLVMIAPGFMADCLETLEEVAVELQAEFAAHGGRHFSVVPCLNDDDRAIQVLTDIVANELRGWID